MKARITKEKETALLYGFTEEKEEAVCGVLEKMNIEVRTVAGESITMTLGALAGLPGFPAVRAADDEEIEFPECEALVLSGVSRQRLDEVLAALKEADLSVQFKAVVTPQNRSWTFEKMLGEIRYEDRMMRVLIPLRQNLERLKGLDLSTIPASHRREVDVAISRARSMSVSRTATPEQVKAANVAMIEAIKKAKEAAIAQD